jgi:hypothetical protein
MATTIPAIMAIIQNDNSALTSEGGTGRRGLPGWDDGFAPAPLTVAQRATVVTALNAGTVATLADVMALIATAATGGVSQFQVWRVMRVMLPAV